MIDAIGVADQGIGHAAEVEQAIPVAVVAGEARDFEPKHDPDMTEGDLGGQARKAAAVAGTGTRGAKIFIDDHDACRRP